MLKKNEEPSGKASVETVTESLNLTKTGKAAGPSGVTSELLKVCQDNSVKKFVEITDHLLLQKEMLES